MGAAGNILMAEIGNLTDTLAPPAGPKEYVPWIVIDGKHNPIAEQDGASGNRGYLVSEVCKCLDNPKPNACSSSPDASWTTNNRVASSQSFASRFSVASALLGPLCFLT